MFPVTFLGWRSGERGPMALGILVGILSVHASFTLSLYGRITTILTAVVIFLDHLIVPLKPVTGSVKNQSQAN